MTLKQLRSLLRGQAGPATFQYTVQKPDGTLANNVIEAANLTDAVARLGQRSLLVINIRPVRIVVSLPRLFVKRARAKSVIQFTRCVATMLHAGLPILKTLKILSADEPDKVLKGAIEDITRLLQDGEPYAVAFGAHPEAFSRLYVSLVKVGETTGNMVSVMTQMADFLERDDKTQSQARAAMQYPLLVFSAALLMVWGLFTWVLPPLLESCVQMAAPGAVLPLPTRILTAMLTLARNPFVDLLALGTLAGAFFAYHSLRSTESGRYRIDSFVLRIPMIGDLVQKILLARFSRSWGMMIEAGISIHSALQILSQYLDNACFREDVVKPLSRSLLDGVPVGESMEANDFFPRMMVNMVSAGDWCGELSRMLLSVANFYDSEVQYAIEAVLSAIEPVMTGLMGVLVCFVLLAVFLPLYQVVMNIH